MTIKHWTPQDRTDQIVLALMRAYYFDEDTARAVLAGHVANELRSLDEEINKLANPYRRRKWAERWYEGTRAVQELMFWKEMRLRATAEKTGTRGVFTGRRGIGTP